ncbi:putative aspartyl protease protein [Botrytis fragariae]|uniref:DNA damage-inducible protein 1 n=1 Tax=Botrytis fragariae TaxID=1964551 RepID=A0A8H6EJY3_9HELO|nr:putative aspartyl protease protein [Botrytis fragariae]KAF5874620.1 putative aspartyl protease protein [Botrytis fragariae]
MLDARTFCGTKFAMYRSSNIEKHNTCYCHRSSTCDIVFKMRITLTITAPTDDDADLISLEIPQDTTVGTLKESVQAESRIPKRDQHLYHNGQLLHDDNKTMEQLQIGDGEMLALHVREYRDPPAATAQRTSQPARAPQGRGGQQQPDPETIRLQLIGNAEMRREVARQNPELAAAADSPERFAAVLNQMRSREAGEEARRRQQIADLNADPFDVDAQMRIAEMIREQRVQENLQNAIEHNPEVFGRVHMLYIDVEVNGHKVKAFVDSGAQATIMSPKCAEDCGIMRLVDKRFAGIARGVGTAAILGRVHSAQIKIGSMFLPCSFTVMEGKDVDLLLGLDMLKRHQACIDLSKDKLIIQGVEVSFLGEADIPKNMEDERAEEPQLEGPGGTTIGAKSGAVSGPSTGQQAPQSASSAPATSASSAPPQQQQPSFPAESIDQLVALGFSRDEAVNALTACGGDVQYAAGLLFQG